MINRKNVEHTVNLFARIKDIEYPITYIEREQSITPVTITPFKMVKSFKPPPEVNKVK